jgi:hypothetical protein
VVTTATLWPIGGRKTKGGINPPYDICEKTGTKGMICCKEIWMTQMKLNLNLKSYKISDVQPCLLRMSNLIAVPKCYTTLPGSGSRLPSGALLVNRNLQRAPKIRTGDCMMYSGDSF